MPNHPVETDASERPLGSLAAAARAAHREPYPCIPEALEKESLTPESL
jgi:hypothetical protein